MAGRIAEFESRQVDRTVGTEQSRLDTQDGTERTGQPENDNKAGMLGQYNMEINGMTDGTGKADRTART